MSQTGKSIGKLNARQVGRKPCIAAGIKCAVTYVIYTGVRQVKFDVHALACDCRRNARKVSICGGRYANGVGGVHSIARGEYRRNELRCRSRETRETELYVHGKFASYQGLSVRAPVEDGAVRAFDRQRDGDFRPRQDAGMNRLH